MTLPEFDANRFKALERAGFNRISARYAQCANTRTQLAEALLTAARLTPGMQVLDLASGPALLAADAARRIGPDGWVVASDIAERMLIDARNQLADTDRDTVSRMSFVAADGEQLCLPDQFFDRVLAGLALFLFPTPEQALSETHRVLKPGGELVLSVWGPGETVPLITCAQTCMSRLLPPPKIVRPSVFRFGEQTSLNSLLNQTGFGNIHITYCDFECDFPDAAAYWQAFLDLAGGVAESLARLPPEKHDMLKIEVAKELLPYAQPEGGYRVPARTLVVRAQTVIV